MVVPFQSRADPIPERPAAHRNRACGILATMPEAVRLSWRDQALRQLYRPRPRRSGHSIAARSLPCWAQRRGKTTLISLVAGTALPTEGTVEVARPRRRPRLPLHRRAGRAGAAGDQLRPFFTVEGRCGSRPVTSAWSSRRRGRRRGEHLHGALGRERGARHQADQSGLPAPLGPSRAKTSPQ